ncbi:hypothetical protein ABW20_dc0104316 [Dactylellina cionopaga]|nr:hypothetical protein ABW20_dc0104316 [Dactylellina cionopaga]
MSSDIDPSSLLYNVSFNLHKLTPLNLNGLLTSQANLKLHSTRLANILRGDVLRGVRVATESDDSTSRTGSLKRADFTPIQIPGLDDGLKAVAIVLLYEKITYSAFLVQNSGPDPAAAAGAPSRRTSLRRTSVRVEQSNYYPLLLTRLPAWLQSRFIEYLVENFDCHVSNLRLPDNFIMRSIESYLGCFVPTGDIINDQQPSKNLQIWLEPPLVTKDGDNGPKQAKLQTLKTILMTFTREDIPGMLFKGSQLKGKQNEEEATDDKRGPFELALSLYAYSHMGVFVEKMKVSKAACGEFIAGSTADGSGKCKFFVTKAATDETEQSLIEGRKKSWDGMIGSLVELAS